MRRNSVVRLLLCTSLLSLALSLARADAGPAPPSFAEVASALVPADQELWRKRNPDSVPRYALDVSIGEDLRQVTVKEALHYTNVNERGTAEESVWLRSFANEGSRVPVKLGAVSCRPVACETVSDGKSLIVLRLSRPLAVGESLVVETTLTMQLEQLAPEQTTTTGQLGDSLAALNGQGSGDYGLLAVGDGIASLAHFYLEVARHRNGQWVGPDASGIGDKGTDDLRHIRARVQVPPGVTLVATGSERKLSDTSYEIMAPAVRDFTLLVSRSFARVEHVEGGVRVTSSGLARNRQVIGEVLDAARHALAVFVAEFGAYPYTELDLVQAPVIGGAGGVEFSGLATVATALYDDRDPMGQLAAILGGDAMPSRPRVREMVVAHEVAHQYWHGLVGSDSRLTPVLDEALAQYSALLYFERRYGRERAEREAEGQVAMNYRMHRMLGRADGPADRPAALFPTAVEYGALVYGKAPYAFRALAAKLGKTTLQQALRRYVRSHRFGEATRADLLAAFPSGRVRRLTQQTLARYFDEAHGDEDLGAALPGLGMGEGDGGDLSELLGKLPALLGTGTSGQGLDLGKVMENLGGMLEKP